MQVVLDRLTKDRILEPTRTEGVEELVEAMHYRVFYLHGLLFCYDFPITMTHYDPVGHVGILYRIGLPHPFSRHPIHHSQS
jgi:hypothetical protein